MTNTILALILILLSMLSYRQSYAQEETPDPNNKSMTGAPETQVQDSEKQTISVPRQDAESIYENQRLTLEQQYPKNDILQLSANGENFIGLWEQDKSGTPVGTVLILHGEGQTANWPHTIDALRANLTHHGWSTLSVSLNDPITAPHPNRLFVAKTDAQKANEPEENTSTQETEQKQPDKPQGQSMISNPLMGNNEPKYSPEELESRMQNRIKAAVSHLNDEGQFNIVIVSHGSSAQRTAEYIQSLPENAPSTKPRQRAARQANRTVRAIIFINARNKANETQTSLVDLLSMEETPILDLYSDMHFLDRLESKDRLKAARNNGMKKYMQVKFLPPTTNVFNDENRVTRRVRGFLSKHAKGVEIGSK